MNRYAYIALTLGLAAKAKTMRELSAILISPDVSITNMGVKEDATSAKDLKVLGRKMKNE